ncbi:sulfurtransferase [Anaeromyxobacter dehalogenans]|uniref:Thiosulfate sulfurtransferase n=1 Tax=Anaeromyxobacter dehalogenans (strain 2CP-C) TaxID=290397 RepID=Q2IFC7_ANADE|nr:sulfurtransferase [Anaeromyxobacter dehalogenans]ABC83281.1 Thiosulfate sulfurtransferase [Anaeromyxobacter dehalogenans 2CP-C]
MRFGPLVAAPALLTSLQDARLLDARPGPDAYAAGHLQGALHADLNVHLSAASAPGFDPARGGRHPLPEPAAWAAQLGAWGIGPDTRVVVYDAAGGQNAAARLWWMLRAFGHAQVAVLDGGYPAAREAGVPVTSAPGAVAALPPYPAQAWSLPTLSIDEVARRLGDPAWKVLDVRSRERWRGEVETLDPVAGRIPGTLNLPCAENLGPDGRFLAPEALRRNYLALLGGTPPEHLVVHCGSGVTACHTLLALDAAGLGGAALYVGSFSEWCRSGRPIGKG